MQTPPMVAIEPITSVDHGSICEDTASRIGPLSQKCHRSGGDELWKSANVLVVLY